jgi:hypothetical protein
MARKDDILKSLLDHEIFEGKYNISKGELPNTVDNAQSSREAIIKAIAMIIDDKEGRLSSSSSTDKELYKRINQYLNEAAI